MGPAPSVRAFLHVFLVFDPPSCFSPFSLLAHSVQFVQLNEHLVRRMVVHLLESIVRYAAFLFAADLHRRMGGLVPPHSPRIVASVRLQVVDVQFLQGTRLFRLHAHSPGEDARAIREAGSRSFPPLRVLLERVLARLVMVSSATYNSTNLLRVPPLSMTTASHVRCCYIAIVGQG